MENSSQFSNTVRHKLHIFYLLGHERFQTRLNYTLHLKVFMVENMYHHLFDKKIIEKTFAGRK